MSGNNMAMELQPHELRKFRRKKRESQGHFWSRFGVTQSRGSRFEKGAEIPRPVAILLELYFKGVLTDGDLGKGPKLVPEAAAPALRPAQPIAAQPSPQKFPAYARSGEYPAISAASSS